MLNSESVMKEKDEPVFEYREYMYIDAWMCLAYIMDDIIVCFYNIICLDRC